MTETNESRVEIARVGSAEDIERAKVLFLEYAASLGFDLDFQGFEGELEGLPGDYAPPSGRLFIARVGGRPAGCAALRKIEGGVCEMKRLYVRPEWRGRGIGKMLAEAIIKEARVAGYTRMRLDAIRTMRAALALYRSLGFEEIPPYRFNPVEGAVYMELSLV